MSINYDKAISDLYLARSEGKTIQAINISGDWSDKISSDPILYGNRIKPQTLINAASNYSSSFISGRDAVQDAFIAGAEWRDKNPRYQENKQ